MAWETKETFGLGEAGSIIRPEMRWVLKEMGILFDIDMSRRLKTLNLLEGIEDNPYLKIML